MLLVLFSVVDDEGVVAAVSVGAAADVGVRWGHGGDERLVCCIAEPLDDDGEQAKGIGISEVCEEDENWRRRKQNRRLNRRDKISTCHGTSKTT